MTLREKGQLISLPEMFMLPMGGLPAVAIRGFLLISKIDSIVEQIEGSMSCVEMLFGGRDRKPDPIHEEKAEEDHHSEPEVVL